MQFILQFSLQRELSQETHFLGNSTLKGYKPLLKNMNIEVPSFDLCDPDLWRLTLTIYIDITSVTVSKSWKLHDDTMREHSEKV